MPKDPNDQILKTLADMNEAIGNRFDRVDQQVAEVRSEAVRFQDNTDSQLRERYAVSRIELKIIFFSKISCATLKCLKKGGDLAIRRIAKKSRQKNRFVNPAPRLYPAKLGLPPWLPWGWVKDGFSVIIFAFL